MNQLNIKNGQSFGLNRIEENVLLYVDVFSSKDTMNWSIVTEKTFIM